MSLLSVKNLSKQFTIHNLGGKQIQGVEPISFDVPEKGALALVGPSGAGKSSVLKCIYRTYIPSQGEIKYRSRRYGQIDMVTASENTIVGLRASEIGYVSQFLRVLPRIPAVDVVAEPMVARGASLKSARKQAAGLLERLNIAETLFDAYPVTFSGGEQQRVNIARAVINQPRLLLLDEPTASLDPGSVALVLQVLQELRTQGTTMVLICHDPSVRAALADAQYAMSIPADHRVAVDDVALLPRSDRIVIQNARVVLADRIRPESNIVIEDGKIVRVGDPEPAETGRRIDADGRLVLPGFIDLHSDVLEKEIQPRPGAQLPLEMVMVELDKKLAASGVTSIYHCLCFTDNTHNELRSTQKVVDTLARIESMRSELSVRTRIHARYEMTEMSVLPVLTDLIENRRIDFFSIMDHTPGQGQFTNIDHFLDYYGKAEKLPPAKVHDIAEGLIAAKARFQDTHVRQLVNRCLELAIPMASHDDDTPEKVAWVHDMGIGTSEFPVTLAAAQAAKKRNMNVLMGAPNIIYGHSLTDNLSGREAISKGYCNLIGSDYSPNSLLHAVFLLNKLEIGSLPQLVQMVSHHPAKVLGRADHIGRIAVGCDADLLLVDDSRSVPRINRTFVRGRQVYANE